jgi:hypothetical protein
MNQERIGMNTEIKFIYPNIDPERPSGETFVAEADKNS